MKQVVKHNARKRVARERKRSERTRRLKRRVDMMRSFIRDAQRTMQEAKEIADDTERLLRGSPSGKTSMVALGAIMSLDHDSEAVRQAGSLLVGRYFVDRVTEQVLGVNLDRPGMRRAKASSRKETRRP